MKDRIRTHRVSITDEAVFSGNVMGQKFVVEVVGFTGSGRFIRRTWEDARACARKYAAMFDAPRKVIGADD